MQTEREHPARLLIVEDDGSLAAGLARALELEGHATEHLDTGEAALARVAETGFDLVVLDIGLPGIDGFEVLRRLRLAGHSMPVLVLTARDAVGDRVHGLDIGADDYMTKPFALPELAARVRALIRRGQADAGPRTTHGPLELDRQGRRAFLQGTPLELAAREWAVLQILLEKVEKVVSKESFIESLTNWEEELSANAIEVYISRLRAKLEPAGIRIRTVRGFGYMLEEFRVRG
jgi:two-component system OmpR family response regulator